MSGMTTERVLTTRALAEHLDVHPETVRRWWRAKTIRPTFLTGGRQARWDLAEVQEQLRAAAAAPAEPEPPPLQPPPVKRPARRTPPAGRPTSWGRLLDPIDSIHEPPHD